MVKSVELRARSKTLAGLGGSCTVTTQATDSIPVDAVITAVPAALPVTTPRSTVATASSEEVQVRVSKFPEGISSAVPSTVTVTSCWDSVRGLDGLTGVCAVAGGVSGSLVSGWEHRVISIPSRAMRIRTRLLATKKWELRWRRMFRICSNTGISAFSSRSCPEQ